MSVADESDKRRHAFLRRLMSPTFGSGALKVFEKTANPYFDEFVRGIYQQSLENGGVVEINGWFHNLAFDVEQLTLQLI
jgi:cytochrome P450